MNDMHNIELLPGGRYRVRLRHRGEWVSGVVETHCDALELCNELKRQIVDGELVPTKGVTACDLGPRFLGSRLGNRSSSDDANRWYRHIATASWARRPLVSITRVDGSMWLKQLRRTHIGYDPAKHGVREPRLLSWQTRKHCLNLARSFFSWTIEEGVYGLTENPFAGLRVVREDGDEDAGYQDGWYLDAAEQSRFFATWDRQDLDLDATDRAEKLIVQFAIGSGLRKGEAWCLHLDDVHVADDEPLPRVEVKYGSWDPIKNRYRPPKGRRGEKRMRVVPLFGLALEAARAWILQLPEYAPKNPLGLMFPTERGARRDGLPRSWSTIGDAFGAIPRIGRKPWWHLLRHTCASSIVSSRNHWRARQDSNLRPTAPEAVALSN